MRVLTYNVQGCAAGVDRIASVVERARPDVVCFNEVRRRDLGPLARALGMRLTAGFPRTFGFGNAVAARTPPARAGRRRFSRTPGYVRRGCVLAVHDGIAFVSVHLGLNRLERARHADELLAVVRAFPRAVVAGDLNEPPDGPAVTALLRSLTAAFGDAAEPFTFPARRPVVRADYVLVTPRLRVARAETIDADASDHLPVVAEIEPA